MTTAALPKSRADQLPAFVRSYRKLHDMISDMIEGGRLTEADIPDDYKALVAQLETQCAPADTGIDECVKLVDQGMKLLGECDTMLDNEEESVQDEHQDLIDDLDEFLRKWEAPIQ